MKTRPRAFLLVSLLVACGAASDQAATDPPPSPAPVQRGFTDTSGVLPGDFRAQPYTLNPSEDGALVLWFTEDDVPGTLTLDGADLAAPRVYRSTPQAAQALEYSALERSQKAEYPDMFENAAFKHAVRVSGLAAGTTYAYSVEQGESVLRSSLTTAPTRDSLAPVRFITYADSETGPEGRSSPRVWGNPDEAPAAQAPGSSGRPVDLPQNDKGEDLYLATEAEGYAANVEAIGARNPHFVVMPGDLVQGGGYQRAWDEFFFHNAGKFGNLLSARALLPALGNWENFGARNGEYEPEAVLASRAKYKAYFDLPGNGTAEHQGLYYRVDYGPVTLITLDSSNGLPQGSDADTNINIDEATYPGKDLADFNPGSPQWDWAAAQLKDARSQGQVIFVQFHHAPYSSGIHGYANASPNASGQGGVPMRVYSPLFEAYGVVAVFSGHGELFERSFVNGVHYYDVGVAGDGLRAPEPAELARDNNPYSVWTAHSDEPELWDGDTLLRGGKHYGHLEVNVVPLESEFEVTLTPVHVFPVNAAFDVLRWERRPYEDELRLSVDREGKIREN